MTGIWLWRRKHEKSQAELARELRMDVTTLRMIEQGRLAPSPRQLEQIQAVLGDQTAALLTPLKLGTDSDCES